MKEAYSMNNLKKRNIFLCCALAALSVVEGRLIGYGNQDPFGFTPILKTIAISSPMTPNENLPKVLCIVNTIEKNHDTKIKAVRETWGTKCDKMVIASNVTDHEIGSVQIEETDYSFDDLWNKHRETLRYAYETYKDDYDWFFKADDDTYVIMENLKAFLVSSEIKEQNDNRTPLHIGNPIALNQDTATLRKIYDKDIYSKLQERTDNKFVFNVGGAGYAMNSAFLEKFMEWVDTDECNPSKEDVNLLDDQMLSFCSSYFGVFPYLHTKDDLGRDRFHQDTPSFLYHLKPDDPVYRSMEQSKQLTGGFKAGVDCCSTESITFHHLEPDEIRSIHDIIYQNGVVQNADPTFSNLLNVVAPGDVLRRTQWWPPQASVERNAIKRRVILIEVSCDTLDIADNLVASILQFGVSNFVLIPTDEVTYELLLNFYPDNVLPPRPVNNDPDDPFDQVKARVPLTIVAFLHQEFEILYLHACMVWKTNIIDSLVREMSDDVDIAFMENSSLLLLKPTTNSISLMYSWASTPESPPDGGSGFVRAIESTGKTLEQSFVVDEKLADKLGYFKNCETFKEDLIHEGLWKPTGCLEQASYDCKNSLVTVKGNHLVVRSSNFAAAPVIQTTITNQDVQPDASKSPLLASIKQSRTLVVLIGGIRGGEPTWQSLYRNVLETNNADLALLFGERKDYSPSLYKKAKYVWEFPEFYDWGVALDRMFGTSSSDEYSWRYIANATSPSGPFSGTNEDPTGGGVVNLIARKILIDEIETLGLLDIYDRFVVTRADQFYPCPLDFSKLDESKMWIPSGEDYKGICDRFLLAPKELLFEAMDILSPVVLHPKQYYTFRGNIESFVKLRWEESGLLQHVARFRRPMFTAYGNSDFTKWNSGNRKHAFFADGIEVQYKYEDEYYQALTSCNYPVKRGQLSIEEMNPSTKILVAATLNMTDSDEDVSRRRGLQSYGIQCPGIVSAVQLIDGVSQNVLETITEGAELCISTGDTVNARILVLSCTTGNQIESLDMSLTGPTTVSRVENVFPYFLYGVDNASGEPWEVGSYTLTITPYSEDNGQGVASPVVFTVNFSVSTCEPPSFWDRLCFSSANTVDVKGIGSTSMDAVKIGDYVRDSPTSFSKVYSFGHLHPSMEARFLQINYSEKIQGRMSTKTLEISHDHFLYIANNSQENNVASVTRAGDVKVGDKLVISGGGASSGSYDIGTGIVTSIETVYRQGFYAPVTESGNIMVSGVLASSHVALWKNIPPAFHVWLSQTILYPIRMACSIDFTICLNESYIETMDGISNYIMFPLKIAEKMSSFNLWIQMLLIVLLLPILLLFHSVEQLIKVTLFDMNCSMTDVIMLIGTIGCGLYLMGQKKISAPGGGPSRTGI